MFCSQDLSMFSHWMLALVASSEMMSTNGIQARHSQEEPYNVYADTYWNFTDLTFQFSWLPLKP